MTRDEVLRAFEEIRVWQRGDQRAVHKPLLILYALGRLLNNKAPMVNWNEADPRLKELLEEFGPAGSSASRHNPFWHLQTDQLWRLDGPAEILTRPPGATPTLTELRQGNVSGGFPETLRYTLIRDPRLIGAIARQIVDSHFPDTIRSDVLAATGFPDDISETPLGSSSRIRRRDPAFRERVLIAYQYRCGVCGHDLRLGRQTIGLEAAHIRWFQANGPDVVENGIALCSMHHKVFDLGVFTVLPETYQIVFSQHLNGDSETTGRMLAHQGAGLILPQSREYFPQSDYLDWHRSQVFKKPART
ncbi:MAG: HNH endonuclease [Betaproteobacteria bacterium]|nr:HNH endonuclease [Betaproteobacteria bacterium]